MLGNPVTICDTDCVRGMAMSIEMQNAWLLYFCQLYLWAVVQGLSFWSLYQLARASWQVFPLIKAAKIEED